MFSYFLKWKFYYSLLDFLKAWRGFLYFGLYVFSVPLLLRTFFWPWHRYYSGYPVNFNPKEAFMVFFGNMMSRIIGMFLRTLFILIGVFFEVFILVVGFLLFAFWFFLPFIILYLFYLGFLYLFL